MKIMKENLKRKVLSSVVWKFLERGGTQGMEFILQILLARLLTPNDYGIIALTIVFIRLAAIFVESGFSSSLIQKQNISEVEYSSVFYINFSVAMLCYFLLFYFSPIIAKFYNINKLVYVIRILGITLFFGAFNSIQISIIGKSLAFKKLFFSNVTAGVISAIIGIYMAYLGYGVWALVFQQLLNKTILSFALYYNLKWYPKLIFSYKKVKKLFSFGWKLLISSLLNTLYNELTNLIVGKKYSPSTLGYYNRGNQFPRVIVGNFNGTIQSVLFPALATLQEDKKMFKNVMRKGIMLSTYIILPCMAGLAIIGDTLVSLILTDKWLPCVPYLKIFCFSYALWPIHTANLQAINAIGRSDIFLKLEIIKKIVGISIILITYRYSPFAMAIGVLVSGIISSFINSYPNKKLLNYSYFEQIKDIYPAFLISVVMAGLIYFIKFLNVSTILILIFQILGGVFIYASVSYLLKVESFMYILGILKNFKKRV